MDISIEIYRFFLFLHNAVFWLFQMAWTCSSNYWNLVKVTFCDLFLIILLTFGNIKHQTIYTQNSTFYTIYDILCVMLNLHVPKIIAYLIERLVLFLHPSSFPIHSVQKTSILEGVIMGIFSGLLHTFPMRASYFLLI